MPMSLVDIGANIGHPLFNKDRSAVIERAKQAGVIKLMITGTSETESKNAALLAETDPGFLYFTAGVHPHDAKDWRGETEEAGDNEGSGKADGRVKTEGVIRELLLHPQCVAVGECGLDYNRNFSPPDVQRKVFRAQLGIACELARPLFIHEREASGDMKQFLAECGSALPPTVIHCFTGTTEEAEAYLALSEQIYIGLTGFLWKDRSENGVRNGLKSGRIPIERLLLETDAPFMYPKINDKKLPKEVREGLTEETILNHKHASFERNEPCALPAICELIAGFAGRDAEEVARISTENAKRVYGLEL